MNKLKRQCGAAFVELLKKSPTLVKDIADIRRAGVKIRRVKGKHAFAESNPKSKIIWISADCHPAYQLTAIAHEKYHVLTRVSPDAEPDFISRENYIRQCLACELGAKKAELKVAAELVAAGVKLDSHTAHWLKVSKLGDKALQREMRKAVTSTTGENYRQYYGTVWDEALDALYD